MLGATSVFWSGDTSLAMLLSLTWKYHLTIYMDVCTHAHTCTDKRPTPKHVYFGKSFLHGLFSYALNLILICGPILLVTASATTQEEDEKTFRPVITDY